MTKNAAVRSGACVLFGIYPKIKSRSELVAKVPCRPSSVFSTEKGGEAEALVCLMSKGHSLQTQHRTKNCMWH